MTGKRSALTRLVIVRHGETDWNHIGRIQGQTDIELNDIGLSQAHTLAEVLRNRGICQEADAVISSDLRRAKKTADVIKAACPQARQLVDPDIGEIDFGDLQGQFFAKQADRMNAVYNAWRSGDFEKSFPGDTGESFQTVVDRGQRALRRASKLGSTVIVVSHLNFLKWTAVGVELGQEQPLPVQVFGWQLPLAELFGWRPPLPSVNVNQSQSMQLPRVKAVSELRMGQIPNCCYSNLMYDHQANSFSPDVWFQPLSNELRPASSETQWGAQ